MFTSWGKFICQQNKYDDVLPFPMALIASTNIVLIFRQIYFSNSNKSTLIYKKKKQKPEFIGYPFKTSGKFKFSI